MKNVQKIIEACDTTNYEYSYKLKAAALEELARADDLEKKLEAARGERDEWEKRSKYAEGENAVLRRMLRPWFSSTKELERRMETEYRAILDGKGE